MSGLAEMAVATGTVIAASQLMCLLAPDTMRAALTRFPRHRVAGWILAALAIFWSGWIVYHAPLGQFDSLKPLLFGAVPGVFFLMVFFVDELLAPRALGGLMLLVPIHILRAARWHESDWRLVMTVLAYVMVVAGMTLVLSPYYFRKASVPWTRSPASCRVAAITGLVFGLAVLALGLTVY